MDAFNSAFGLLILAVLLIKIFALVDAAIRPAQAYTAADKQSKNFWLILLGVLVAFDLIFGGSLGLISLVGLIAALVYLVDVRPAVKAVGGGRSGSQGPYGPW